jgi:hypothetical protein
MKMAVFWVVAPCNLVEVYRRFRSDCTAQEPIIQPSSRSGVLPHHIVIKVFEPEVSLFDFSGFQALISPDSYLLALKIETEYW